MNSNLALLNATNLTGAQLTNELRAIKPPVVIPSGWAWLWWALGLLALAGLSYLAWRWWQKRRQQAPPIVIIPPHVRARQKLQEALALLEQPGPFCVSISNTIRIYLEERFNFRAPERTTEEFLHELKETELVTVEQKHTLGEFLNRCDLVKFARYEPGRPELEDVHASAVRLVDETEPALPEQATQHASRITQHVQS